MKRPLLIGIGGAYSGIGKTTAASAVISHLTKHPIYPFSHPPKIGAIKYTKTAFYSSIVDDRSIIRQENKDTKKLLDAGSENVLWVQSPQNELDELLPLAIGRLSGLDCVIVEGNSAIEFLKPDVVIFLFDGSRGRIKPSAVRMLKMADIIVLRDEEQRPEVNGSNTHKSAHYCSAPDPADKKALKRLMDLIEMTIKEKDIEKLLRKKSDEGMLTCSEARKIAEELGVPYKEVGKTADKLKIKIKNCELNCF